MSLSQTDIIQNVRIWIHDNKLAFNWDLQETDKQLHAISIEVCSSIEFIGPDFRHYVLPPVKGCSLDVGGAPAGTAGWNIRLAAWTGTDKKGILQYTGVYGPIPFYAAKPPPVLVKPNYTINYTQAVDKGVKFFMGEIKKQYALIEYSNTDDLKGVNKKCIYSYDWIPEGVIECSPLDPSFTYSIRLTIIGETLPKDSIKVLDSGIIQKNKKPMAQVRHIGTTDRTESVAYHASIKQPIKFASHQEYIRHLAAKEKHSSVR